MDRYVVRNTNTVAVFEIYDIVEKKVIKSGRYNSMAIECGYMNFRANL